MAGEAAAGAGVSGVFGIMQTGLNNFFADERTREDRAQNYLYGEMSAEHADWRTRALYNDFYSPEALLRQYKKAGLSPSMMFGGTPGQGGTSGAQGTGAAGPQTPFMPFSMLEAAQVANIIAQTQKTKAETSNIMTDTQGKELANEWQQMQNQEHSVEFKLTTTYLKNKETGEVTSLFELAQNCYDYDQFLKLAREMADDQAKLEIGTEAGQRTMRQIYMNTQRMDRDIKVLSEERVSADFQKSLMNCLQKKGFAELNAETAIKQLEAAGEAAELTKEQKGAWNNILERLRKTNSTAADIIIVASMILNQAASHWNGNVWGTKQ